MPFFGKKPQQSDGTVWELQGISWECFSTIFQGQAKSKTSCFLFLLFLLNWVTTADQELKM